MAASPLLLALLLLFLAFEARCALATEYVVNPFPSNVSAQALQLSKSQLVEKLREQTSQALNTLLAVLKISVIQLLRNQPDFWIFFCVFILCIIMAGLSLWNYLKRSRVVHSEDASGLGRINEENNSDWNVVASDAAGTDPALLKKHSTWESYSTSIATYPAVRTFYKPHDQADKLPQKPKPIPLLVFIHGLGGSLAQFSPILKTLVNIAPCLGIDMPGCGLSKFAPRNWEAYSIEALAELLAVVIEGHRDYDTDQDVILIAHSLGCSFSALLASKSSPLNRNLAKHVVCMVAICPQAEPPGKKEARAFRNYLRLPNCVFDLYRRWDKRGGLESPSVSRYVGIPADIDTKKLQLRFNQQSSTPVFKRMAVGALSKYDDSGKPVGGIPGRNVWHGIQIPLLLIGGEADAVTSPLEVKKIADFVKTSQDTQNEEKSKMGIIPNTDEVEVHESAFLDNISQHDEKPVIPPSEAETEECAQADQDCYIPPRKYIKTSIIPSPASHALLYDVSTYRTVNGLIQDFLASHVDKRLSLGWQLHHLASGGKWDVKNLEKWKSVEPVSGPIANTFRAMKTLREVDEIHAPKYFVERWGDKIKAVVDISHDSPVYNPAGLEEGGMEYHKFPTVSKIPPTPEEVRDFIKLINRLCGRHEHDDQHVHVSSEKKPLKEEKKHDDRLVGVHCHYGFNRTGFFIVSYLIEQMGFGVQEAIDEFKKNRYPGIRHDHFIDALFVRYAGLRKTVT